MALTGDLTQGVDGFNYMMLTINEDTDFVRVVFLKKQGPSSASGYYVKVVRE